MRHDREMAVLAMQNMGWTAKRTKPGKSIIWEFTRPDTGGLWDMVKCNQANLSMHFVAGIAMQHGDAPELVQEIQEARERWLKDRFLGIYSRAAGEEQ
jgi:hypothetical protein